MRELHAEPPKHVLRVDNAAAIGLAREAPGSWKTRHLRIRAAHLQDAVRLRQLRIAHIAGTYQLADLGTQAFDRNRLRLLVDLWGLRSSPENADEEESDPLSTALRC